MQIMIRRVTGPGVFIDVEASDRIDTVIAKIAEITGSPAEQFHLYLMEGQLPLLDNGTGVTLSGNKIHEGEDVLLKQHFEIVIETFAGRTFTLEVEAGDDIGCIKCAIDDQEGIDSEYIQLVFGNTPMDDNKFVLDYGLKAGSRVQLVNVAPPGSVP